MEGNGDLGGGGPPPWRPKGLAFCNYRRSHGSGGGEGSKGSGGLRVVVKKSLVSRLTKDIVETYQQCNPNFKHSEALNPKRFLTSPHVGVLNDGFDNSNSDLILSVNFVLINGESKRRYIVKEMLGQGTFGQVVKCWVPDSNTYVAVKVIKNQPAYCQQAIHEVNILRTLNQNFDRENKHHIVQMHEFFIYQHHLCISFEMLGSNLYEVLKMNNLKGLPLNLIQMFSKQILHALIVMKDAGIIHCDLKPENILLWRSVKPYRVKVIDFGSACKEDQTVYSYIQSRYYRSPEVLLSYQYTTAIDMWSFGCIVAELFLGLPLFPASSEYDLLKRMIEVIGGQPPDILLRDAKKTNKFFKYVGSIHHLDHNQTHRNSYAYRLLTEEEVEVREQKKPLIGRWYFNHVKLEDIVGDYPYKKNLPEEEKSKERLIRLALIDFVKGLIEFDPEKRWTPLQASGHPFVTGEPFTQPYCPPPVAYNPPVVPSIRVDHGPDRGHWLASGLSPQVSNINRTVQHSSPHLQRIPISRGSSHGSLGSYGSYGDSLCLFGSYGSYGDNNKLHDYYSPSVSSGPRIPVHGRSTIGASPDGRAMPQYSYGTGFGMSPTFRPMSLGASPSQFTPPNSQIKISPGKYGQSPTSPSKGSSYGSQLGKAAAMGQYQKRRSWGHPGTIPIQLADGASQHKYGHHSDGSHSEQNSQGLSCSPRSFESTQSSWRKERIGKDLGSGIPLPIHQNHRSLHAGKSTETIYSSESFSSQQECSSSLLDSGHWDPNFSDDILQEEGLDGNSLASGLNSIHLAIETDPAVFSIGSSRQKHGCFHARPFLSSPYTRTDGQISSYTYARSSSSSGLDIHAGYKYPTYLPNQMLHFPQGSPSRFAQQPGRQFSQMQQALVQGDGSCQKVQLMQPNYSSEDPCPPANGVFRSGNAWGQAGHPIATTLPAYHSRNDYGRIS